MTSDGLEDGSVVSGVGGQYNFLAQAFALPDARSIMTLPATRGGAKPESNIRYAYGHTTIPRHLRDIVVTEYGVANLRGASDHAVVERMLGIADARFQAQLLAQARKAGKVDDGCRYSESWARNTPQHLDASLKDASDLLPSFPFGSDFPRRSCASAWCFQQSFGSGHR